MLGIGFKGIILLKMCSFEDCVLEVVVVVASSAWATSTGDTILCCDDDDTADDFSERKCFEFLSNLLTVFNSTYLK